MKLPEAYISALRLEEKLPTGPVFDELDKVPRKLEHSVNVFLEAVGTLGLPHEPKF